MRRAGRATLRRLDDAELIERSRSGDHRATEELLRRAEPQVRSVCRRICGSFHDAEDAAQDALASINVGLPRFDGRSSFGTWVHRIATNRALDELRRRRRRPVPTNDEGPDGHEATDAGGTGSGDPEREALRRESRRELAEALASLPDVLAEAVALRDVADLDYATIASELGVPVGTVRSRIARGRSQLATALRDTPGWNRTATGGVQPQSPTRTATEPTEQHP